MRFTVTGPDLGAAVDDVLVELRAANRAIARAVAAPVRKALLDDVRSARGSLRMAGGRLGVKTTIEPGATQTTITLSAKPAGPWAIVETGATPHPIRPRRAGALAFAGEVRRAVDHPGTRGRRLWASAESTVDRVAAEAIADVYDTALGV